MGSGLIEFAPANFYAMANRPTPAAGLFNLDHTYRALYERQFVAGTSPYNVGGPIQSPGGTIYRSGSSDIYYPQGNDWGTGRRLHFAAADAIAAAFSTDLAIRDTGEYWEALHGQVVLDMQARFSDGRTYGATSEDTYPSREEWIANIAARAWAAKWIVAQNAFSITNEAYTEETSTKFGVEPWDADLAEWQENRGSLLVHRDTAVNAEQTALMISGSAASGSDFIASSAPLAFPDGLDARLVFVHPVADTLVEGPETIVMGVGEESAMLTLRDQPFDDWRFRHLTPTQLADPDLAAPDADADGNGLANVVEFVLAIDSADIGSRSFPGTIDLAGSRHLTLSYRRAKETGPFQAVPKISDELSAWSPTVIEVSREDRGDHDFITVRDPLPLGARPSRFLSIFIE